MKISAETQDLMIELNDFSGHKLKNIDDLSYINEIALLSGNVKIYYDLQFSAKYVNGLSKILQDNLSSGLPGDGSSRLGERAGISQEDAAEKIKNEFKTNILKFTELLKELLMHADKETRTEFEKKYLSLTKESMLNLNTLIYDLSWLKKYNNSRRS